MMTKRRNDVVTTKSNFESMMGGDYGTTNENYNLLYNFGQFTGLLNSVGEYTNVNRRDPVGFRERIG